MNVFLAAFLLLPPILLGAKAYWKWRVSAWWLFGSFVLVGWALVNLAIWRYFDYLSELALAPGASDELREAAQSDGAAQVFGLFLGWAYSAAYFAVWAFLRSVIAFLHGRIGKTASTPG
jgi:hypothetical protein